MNSAVGQNDCYLHYISAIWEGPLRVTAELIEMAQYIDLRAQLQLVVVAVAAHQGLKTGPNQTFKHYSG